MNFTVFSFIYLFTTVLASIVFFLARKRKLVAGARELSLLALSVCICAFFSIFEAAATNVEEKLLWSKLSYFGSSTVSVFYFLFVYRFTKGIRLKDIRFGWALFIIPLATMIIAFTNEYHHLLWSGFSPVSPKTNIMRYYHGYWFWFGYTAYTYILLSVATFYLIGFIKSNGGDSKFKKQALLVVFAGCCPWLASVCYVSGIDIVYGLDITPISTTICAVLFTYAIMNGNILDIIPVARETLVETLPVGIIALDSHNRIQDINNVSKSFFCIKDNDILGLTLRQAGSITRKLEEAVTSDEISIQVDDFVGGIERSFLVVKRPIKSAEGSRLVTINDITEQKMIEKELYNAKVKAEESDNLKSAFLANMSHEIRTPMNCIMGFISILQTGEVSESERNEYLEIVKRNCDRLLKTLDDIIDISKIEAGQVKMNITEFDINEVLTNMYSMFKSEAESKGLEYYNPDLITNDLSLIRTDREKIYSITTNLIKNALKYTLSGYVRYMCTVNENEIMFSVEDSGIGIASNKQNMIFERFVQVDSSRKRSFEGSGLGLAITKAYVDMLGGSIWLESEENKGSTFHVKLPVEHVSSIVVN